MKFFVRWFDSLLLWNKRALFRPQISTAWVSLYMSLETMKR
jgi:hypothetical protein